jgi:glycosyltransferase involved in cell wall biosynthesis
MNKQISVIVPVYNDPSGLNSTLNSLVEQGFPKDLFEIIVADNGSTDYTLSVIDFYIKKFPGLIRTVRECEIQSSYAARNKAIREAKGSVIAFIDADMTVEEDWLSNVVEYFKKNNLDYMGCHVEVGLKRGTMFELYNKMVSFPIKDYLEKKFFIPTCCLVVKKKIFGEVGFFDWNLISGGDREFGNRVYEAEYKIQYASGIHMRHPVRYTPKQILHKAFRTGRGSKQVSFYYPDRYKMKVKNIFNPRYFFPLKSIFNFTIDMKENRIWLGSTYLEKLLFCLIHCLYMLINHLGYIYESLFGDLNAKKDQSNE